MASCTANKLSRTMADAAPDALSASREQLSATKGLAATKGSSISSPGKPKNQMSFPPLVHKWTVKSEADWPGAEYTRRTRLKTRCEETYNAAFLDEVKALLGETNFNHYQEAMRPSINRRINRGKPPAEGWVGATPIHPSATLRRRGGDLTQTMSSTTFGMSGQQSRTRLIESTKTKWGDVPCYMWDNQPAEPVASLDEWFLTYGRPTPCSLNLGPKNMYTEYEPLSKRVCGKPSLQQRMKKGVITA